MKIQLDHGDFNWSYELTLLDQHGKPTGRSLLFQTDWDYPGLASAFGWEACPCGQTDGTVNCPHREAHEMIAEAQAYLDDRIGEIAEDPGYFLEEA